MIFFILVHIKLPISTCADTITEDCANMDPSCRWQCGTNTTAVQHTRLPQPEEEAFCNGAGTDMFMQGFQVTTTTIVGVNRISQPLHLKSGHSNAMRRSSLTGRLSKPNCLLMNIVKFC